MLTVKFKHPDREVNPVNYLQPHSGTTESGQFVSGR
jgi:hypothetical protein